MLKIFETGDNHIGLKYSSHEKKQALINARIDAFKQMVSDANQEQCDLFCITGDLFENNHPAKKDVSHVIDLLSEFHGTVIVLPGNHDYYTEDGKVWKYFQELTENKDQFVLLKEYKPYELKEDNKDIVIYPALCTTLHSDPGENNLGWMKQQNIIPDEKYRIGMAHGSVEGESIDQEGAYFLMTRKELNDIPVDVWLIGHTHVPFPDDLSAEKYKDAGRIFNAGTHVQTDVANHTDGECFIIEIEEGNGLKKVKAKKYVSGNLRFYRNEISVKPGELKSSIENKIRNYGDNSVVDLILKGSVSDEEYTHRNEIIEECLNRFIEGTYNTYALSRQITAEVIDREFPETSFSSSFLKALLDDPKETQMAYELIETIREKS